MSADRAAPEGEAAPPGGAASSPGRAVTLRHVAAVWWPLAASWLLMGLELPAVSAVMARLARPTISLAAYGGIVFPLALIIESPVIMLLAASTALSRNREAHALLQRVTTTMGAVLTALHVLIAFTPLYHVVVGNLIGAPLEIREPARIGLMILTPWTWSIAYRRFQQGVLIRAGRSRTVGVGTAVRLTSEALVLAGGALFTHLPGIVVGASAVAAGVLSEAAFVGLAVRPVLATLRGRVAGEDPLRLRGFLHFYVPLALTSMITLAVPPLASASISRMPLPVESLAAWTVVTGLVFLMRSMGFALNEVVVALLEQPGAARSLRRFAWLLGGATSLLLLLVAGTPLSGIWFGGVSGLPPALSALAGTALWICFLMPALSAMQSWFQGVILHSRITRAVTEAVVVYLGVTGVLLGAGIVTGRVTGIYVAIFAIVAGSLAQIAWLAVRARGTIRGLLRGPEAA